MESDSALPITLWSPRVPEYLLVECIVCEDGVAGSGDEELSKGEVHQQVVEGGPQLQHYSLL